MPLVKMTVGYDGTAFYGSQTQGNRRTVQSELEAALRRIGAGDARLALAGRTDRGVHALGQVASGWVEWDDGLERLRSALNAVCQDDIVVSEVVEADGDFHARFSARWREYRYRIVVAEVPPVLERHYVWWRRREIDPDLAVDACSRLTGTHGFGSFAGGGWSRARPAEELTRTVYLCRWHHLATGDERGNARHELRIVANGFLPRMVRNITAAVVEVAMGAQRPEWIDELLAAGDRGAMKDGAPPHGLVLWRVGYSEFDSACQA